MTAITELELAIKTERSLAHALQVQLDRVITRLSFTDLAKAGLARAYRWHPGGLTDWSVSDWAVAAAGEIGEALNAVKKYNRARDGIQGATATAEDIGKEIADTVIYLDLLAQRLGLSLETLVREKFNAVSEREGFPERI